MATIVYVWLVLACPQPSYPQHLAVPMANLPKNNEDDSGHPFDGARLLDFAILRPYLQHPAVSHDPSPSSSLRRELRRSMDMAFLFFGFLALLVLVHGQDQSGFISIDCGIAEGSDYKDNTTGLLYTSDAKFIDTGINGKISSKFRSATLIPQLTNVRSFPEGAKNCYTLRPKHGKNNNYLIRAFFMYGNYDSKDQPPEFKLHLGVEEWDTVNFTHSDKIVRREIIHVPKTDDIYVCLANTGSGTPFISALELRPLDSSTYTTESGSLELFARVDVGTKTNETVRYKDDVFDRIWDPISWDYWDPINSSYVSSTLSNNEYKPPSNVMSTAVIPALDSISLEFYWDTDDPSQQFYVYMYFAEVEQLETGELREFNISLNGGSWRGPIVPEKMIPTTIWNTDSISAPGSLNFSISKTDDSTRPPILNALEIYSVKQFLQSPTGQNEVDAIKKIKSVYKVMKSSWQGDPCIPRDYLWDGLICSDNGYDAPSIISLLDGNPDLCKTSSCKGKNLIVPIVSCAVSVLVLLGVFAIFWIYKRKQQQGVVVASKPNDPEEKIMRHNNRHVSYSEIVSITGNFQQVIGKGGFGKVYSGHLSDGTQVAVKMLSSPSTHGSKQCRTEAELLTRVHHRNLVSLLGYCDESPNMGLMYEYMANGNLQECLSGINASVLTWEQRLRIAIDAAQALEYLHNGCKPPIIHRDVKTANILLDEKLQAKVADFGLSRCLPPENGNCLSGSNFSTAISGTPGYLDPEYYTSLMLDEKSDVYSFGIVLLELITGQLPIIKQGEESMLHIVQWVSPIIERGEIRDIVDQRLQGDFDISSVGKAIDIAMACVTYSSTTRPTMSHVLLELKGCLNIEIAPERTRSMEEDNEKQANDSLEMIFVSTEIPKGPQER
ncbi:senescence-induced receptor-like serine/threonine-protein kinase [Vitis riparia]|uniref:senescence-induced receptor-like serine/threonine-protein kinase n=1 Tax=Vitis riparia TaxID=96939 RepID=UPI00155AC018|nr:senescence-induced receptor-like serine/threonine-protein kinase [Vitis riparia]